MALSKRSRNSQAGGKTLTTLEQIAQKLKATREGKGLTLEQIYEKTRIPLHHLEGLDEGRFDDLPEPVYVSGFIKLYANQLGLNGQLLANEYREWAENETPSINSNGSKRRIKSAPDVPIIVSDDYFQKNKIDTSPPTFKTFYFNLIMIVLVLGLISYLGMTQFNNYNNQLEGNVAVPQSVTTSGVQPSSAGSQSSAGTTEPGTQGTAAGSTATGTTNTAVPASSAQGRNQLVLSSNHHVWVEVKSAATGDNLFIGFLEPGSRRTFDTPEQGLRIHAADGGDVSVNYQGKITALGESGQETEKVFAPAVEVNNTAGAAPSGVPGAGKTGPVTPAPAGTNVPATAATGSTGPGGRSEAGSSAVTSGLQGTSTGVSAAKAAASSSAVSGAIRRRRYLESGYGLGTSASSSSGQSYKYSDGRLDAE